MAEVTWCWAALIVFALLINAGCGRGKRGGVDFLMLMPHLTVSKKARGRGEHPGWRRSR